MVAVDALLVCDAATRDAQSGKWTLAGIFDAVWAAGFPVVHRSLDVYFRVRSPGAAPLRLSVRAPSGALTTLAAVTVAPSPRGMAEGAVRVEGLALEAPGEYRFELALDDRVVGDTGLTVAELPPPSGPVH